MARTFLALPEWHVRCLTRNPSSKASQDLVSLGAEVKEDTTVCLIEVMKTFNAMTAGVKGVITEICAENAQLVEYGQVLFRVRPS